MTGSMEYQSDINSLAALRARLLRHDLGAFIAQCFHTVSPHQPYRHNWHIDLIADYLEAVARGEISRLIINMPPRSLKSICVSVAWPAWLLAHNPTMRIMAASYSQQLATKHSLDCRLVMQSAWYRQLFPDTQLASDQNEKHKFATTRCGMRFATSVGGTATGEGGHVLIADDVMSPLQAHSDSDRQMVNDWFDHTFTTRLDDKRHGAIVLVMQRLHAQDITAHLLEKGGWEHLCLPAIAETSQRWKVGGRIYRRTRGSLLHPAREDRTLMERAKRELGSAHFSAQYQQQPLPTQGGMIQLEWFARF